MTKSNSQGNHGVDPQQNHGNDGKDHNGNGGGIITHPGKSHSLSVWDLK